MSVTKLLSDSLKVGFFAIFTILFSNLCAFSQDVSITITPIEKLDDQLTAEIIAVVDDGDVLLYNYQNNKFYVYSKEGFVNNHCPAFEFPEGYEKDIYQTRFLKLKDGDIFIIRFLREIKNQENKKTAAYIYSTYDNKIKFLGFLPKEITGRNLPVQLSTSKFFFFGEYDDEKKTKVASYIYDIENKSLIRKADTKKERGMGEGILLKDGRILIVGGIHKNNVTAELYDIKKDEFTEIPTGFRWNTSYGSDDMFMTDDGKVVIRTNCFVDEEKDGIGIYSGSIYIGSGYSVPRVAIFNPQDNSFTKVDFNKNDYLKINEEYSITVTPNGKIILAGGAYVKNVSLEDSKAENELKQRKSSHHTKNYNSTPALFLKLMIGNSLPESAFYNMKNWGNVNNQLIFYDIKTGEKKYSCGKIIPYVKEPEIYALNNNEIIIHDRWGSWQKSEHKYKKIKF